MMREDTTQIKKLKNQQKKKPKTAKEEEPNERTNTHETVGSKEKRAKIKANKNRTKPNDFPPPMTVSFSPSGWSQGSHFKTKRKH